MVEIIPASMPDDFEELTSDVARVRHAASWVQVDVMDGRFTDSISWPYAPGSTHFTELVNDEAGLPFWEDIDYEIDLMVSDPFTEAPRWLLASAARLIVHHHSFGTRNPHTFIDELRAQGAEVVLALLPSDDASVVEPYAAQIDGIQCMGIERVGFQGEPFDDRVISLLQTLRAQYPEMPLSVDGGVNDETAPLLVAAGATRLVAGSFIFSSEDAKASIAELKKISNV